ncbi:MAG: cbb3-type cytochrome c oxidase subunit I, partial [Alphaproteobacteria bacterium]
MAIGSAFRLCPVTGFNIHRPGEALIKVNAVTGVVFLAIGGVFAILVALTRWPAVHLLDAEDFYLVLTAHGLDMLIVWILFFEVALLYFASAVLLNSRLATPWLGWVAYALMLGGALVINVVVLQGESSVMFTSYPPMQADPLFYLGLIAFAVGALIACMIFFATLVVAKEEKTYEGSIPLVTFGAMTAAIIAVFTIASGAIILIPTFLWSIGLISYIDPLMYKLIWWGMGHSSQQINVSAHVAVWYAIAAIVLGAKPLSEKVSRGAFLLYILFLQLASAHHLLVEPALSSEWKIFNTSYAMYLAVLGSMIHGLTVPGSIEAAQRKKGFTKGLFEWLRKAPWGNPAFAGMFMSLVLFGFLGGISGVVMGTEQINLIIHNTLYVPGHFHATVVTGTTLAFMALSFFLVPTLFQRDLIMPGLARLTPYIFGFGMAGVSLFLMGAGTLGIPRRHWDIAFTDAVMGFDFPPAAYLMLGLNGISAILATLGGILFVTIMVGTILFGRGGPPPPP